MSSSKKFTCKRTQKPTPPLSHCIRVYSIPSIPNQTEKGEGRELNQREGERGIRGEYRSQSWVENTHMTECTQ